MIRVAERYRKSLERSFDGAHSRFPDQGELEIIPMLAKCGGAAPILGAVIGGLGLLQSANAQKGAQNSINKAYAPQEAAQNAILQLAQGYNPAMEDQRAITSANQNAQGVLRTTLGNMAGRQMADGGSPGGSSEFAVGATNASNRVLDPLRQFTAQLAATETQRKAGMFNQVFAAPAGQMANTYFNEAQMANQNWASSLQMFGNALKQMPGWGGTAPGSGGNTGFNFGGAGDTTNMQTDQWGNPINS